MTERDQQLRLETRRHFFSRCGVGIGQMALASLLAESDVFAETKATHFPPRIRNIIYLFMAGGPSQFEMLDYKPVLQKHDGKVAPESILNGKRFAFMDTFAKAPPHLLGTRREFTRCGKGGLYISELLPQLKTVADDIALISGISTENFNHGPAKCFMNTGSTRFGRPSMGAWATYGIGSEAKNLPGFVVLQSGPRGPRGGAALWGSGFLPTAYQGVPFRSGGEPILDLTSPPGVNARVQKQALETIRDLNLSKLAETRDPEIETRIAAYEMAYQMQSSGPELIDFSKESAATQEMYGVEPGKSSYANNCLLARRLVERGVRFVQLYHTDWDHHSDLGQPLEQVCREIDRPTAALIRDLKQRGLLDQTLVVWGGEFGRTPMGEVRESGKIGRNHHIDAFTIFVAGGGIEGGRTIGGTDELGFAPVEQIQVHDVHATILHMLGLDHTRLTFRFQGRNFRLTDVAGKTISKLLG